MTTINAATIGDAPALLDIYNLSVATSHSNFDTRPSTIEERQRWFAQFSDPGPYRILVARSAKAVFGYACTSRYRTHEAFRETVEVSVSLQSTWRGQGIGTLLYAALFECLADEEIHVALAGIAMPNNASVALHRKFGFTEVGVFQEYATKNGRYISSVWMQRLFNRR